MRALGDGGLSVGSVKGATVGEAIGILVGSDVIGLTEGGLFVGSRVGSSVGTSGFLVGLGVTGLVDGFNATVELLVVGGLISTTFCDPKSPLTFAKDLPSSRISK